MRPPTVRPGTEVRSVPRFVFALLLLIAAGATIWLIIVAVVDLIWEWVT